MLRATSPRLVLLGAAILLCGCTTTVVGTASPGSQAPGPSSAAAPSTPAAESAGPFEQLLGQVSLSDTIGEYAVVLGADALSDGHVVTLIHMGRDEGFVVDLAPGVAGIEIADVLETRIVSTFTSLHATPDDTVVMDNALSPPDDPEAYDVKVLERGATQVESRPLDPPVERLPTFHPSDLSPDGRTLFLGFSWSLEDGIRSRVVAVDVATGQVTAEVDLPDDFGPADLIVDLESRPDGGPTLVVLRDPTDDGEFSDAFPVLEEFDPDLTPLRGPVQLIDEDENGRTRALTIAPDGTATVVLAGSAGDEPFTRIVQVTAGETSTAAELDIPVGHPPEDAVTDPDGRFLYLPYGDGDQWVFSTLDLDSGQIVASVPLCPIPEYSLPPIVVLADDAQSAAVLATCTEDGLVSAFLVA